MSSRRAEVITYKPGEDPKAVILNAIGKSLDGLDIFGDRVMIATAPHQDRSAGGVLFGDSTIEEERYQGKVGLILKMGDSAFQYNGQFEWEGKKPKIGSWIFYRTSDTFEIGIAGISCRLIRDYMIVGEVSEPGLIW